MRYLPHSNLKKIKWWLASVLRSSIARLAFFDLHWAGDPLALCMHLMEKGLSLREVLWTARQSKSGFSVRFYWEQMGSPARNEEEKKERWSRWVKTEISSIRPTPTPHPSPKVDIADDLSSPGKPISSHQCIVTRRLPPLRENLPSSARKLEKYENVQVYAKLEDCSSVEVEMRNG